MAEADLESNPRFSSKYEDLVRHQLSHSSSQDNVNQSSGEGDVSRMDASDSKRHTPVGDIAAENGASESGDDVGLGARLVDDVLWQRESSQGKEDQSYLALEEENVSKGGRHTPLSRSSVEAELEKQPGSRPYTPERLLPEPKFRRPSAESDKVSVKSRESQDKRVSDTESIEDIIKRYSGGSQRQTPTALDAVEDVLGGETRVASSGRRTPQRESHHWPERLTPSRDNLSEGQHQSPVHLPRKSEVKDEVSSPSGSQTQEVPSRPESVGSAEFGTSSSQRSYGRPTSLTSEQELSQYFDRTHSRTTPTRSGPTPPRAESDTLNYPAAPSNRPFSSSSLPLRPVPPQQGRVTPDYQVRLPSRQTPLESKPVDRATPSSIHSSRTVTPLREMERPPSTDVDSSISNLRKLLFSREAEVDELKTKLQEQRTLNKSLTDQLDRFLRDPATQQHSDLEHRCQQLQSEKEILAAEVVKLRDALLGSGRADCQNLSRITFDPDSPEVLQKRIEDLMGQIKDLQEASEAATNKLTLAENRARELHEENDRLRREGDLHRRPAPEKEMAPRYREPDLEIRREMQQLREDINVLKGMNYAEDRSSHYRRDRQDPYLDFGRNTEDIERPKSPLLNVRPESRERRMNYRMENTSEYQSLTAQQAARTPLTRDNLEKLKHSRYTDDLEQLDVKPSSKHRSPDLPGIDSYQRHPSSDDIYESRHARVSSAYNSSSVGLRDHYGRSEEAGLHNGRHSYSAHTRESHYLRSKISGPEELRGSQFDRSLPDGQAEVKSANFQQSGYSSAEKSRRELSSEFRDGRSGSWRPSSDYDFLNKDSRPDVRMARPTDDPGDVSDTATEILLSIHPGAQLEASTQPHHSYSFSDDSEELLSDTDNPGAASLHRRSRSLDAKRSGQGWMGASSSNPTYGMSSQLRTSTSTEQLASSPSPPPSSNAGFRSITPKPLTTQHNKSWNSSSNLISCTLTHGMRPFAPRSPADMRLGDVVKFSRQGGRLSQGMVKFVGHLPGRSDAYLGVELDKEGEFLQPYVSCTERKADTMEYLKASGTSDGIAPFVFFSKPSKGVFVAFNKIVMAWAPC